MCIIIAINNNHTGSNNDINYHCDNDNDNDGGNKKDYGYDNYIITTIKITIMIAIITTAISAIVKMMTMAMMINIS